MVNIKSQKNQISWLIVYYCLLYLIQLSWLNDTSEPSYLMRVVFTTLVFVPALKRIFLVPFIFSLFALTQQFYISNSYFLLNLSIPLSFIILVIAFVNGQIQRKFSFDYFFILLVFIYFIAIDVFNGRSLAVSDLSAYVLSLSIMVLIYPFLIYPKASDLMAVGFIIFSFVISITYFFNRNLIEKATMLNTAIEQDFYVSRDTNYLSSSTSIALLISLMVYFGIYQNEMLSRIKKWILPYAGFIVVFIVSMTSRTTIISTFVTVFTIYFFRKKQTSSDKKANVYFYIVTSFIILLITNYGLYNNLLYRFFQEGTLQTGSGRTEIAAQFFKYYNNISLNKTIFGSGYGFQYSLTGGSDTHNEYLAILASYGILGSLLWLLFLKRLFVFNKIKLPLIVLLYYILLAVSLSPFMNLALPLFLIWALSIKRRVHFATYN